MNVFVLPDMNRRYLLSEYPDEKLFHSPHEGVLRITYDPDTVPPHRGHPNLMKQYLAQKKKELTYSLPFVLGTPFFPVNATAWAKAIPNALKTASHWWWSFLPENVMWAVMPAFVQRV